MKIRRQKNVHRVLTFYGSHYNLTAPYRVLVDGTFCKAALKFKVNIMEQLPKYFDAEVMFFTTPCVIKECESLGALLYGPLKVLQQYELHQCNHKEPFPVHHCIHSIARRQKKSAIKYFVATQDALLSTWIRELAGVPLLFISHNTITLEVPSDKSKKVASLKEMCKVVPSDYQKKTIDAMKKSAFGEEKKPKMQKKKKKKGPNPLSCKKKKKKVSDVSPKKTNKKSRRRRRKKHGGVTSSQGTGGEGS